MVRRSPPKPPPPAKASGARDSYARRAETLRREVRASEGSSPWEEAAEALAEYGDACRFAGRIEESEKSFRELLERARGHDHPRLSCIARTGLGNALCARSLWSEAEEVLRPGLADAAATDEPVLRARVECVLASALFNQGALGDAAELLAGALRTAREYEVPDLQVPALVSLGVVALARGDDAAAGAHLEDGVRRAERHQNHHWSGMGRSYLAMHAHLRGELDPADALYQESQEELGALGLRRALGVGAFARALLALARGEWELAEERLHRADDELAVTCPDYAPLIQCARALTFLSTGHSTRAQQRLAHARTLCDPSTPAAFLWAVEQGEALLDGDALAGEVPESIEARLFRLALRRVADAERAPSLVVDAEARRARVLPRGELVDLSRRGTLRGLLQALLGAHQGAPGAGVTDEALITAGWPGEKIDPRAARVRLQTAISTLRKLGLAPCLERSGEGYRLRPELVVREVSIDSSDLRPIEGAPEPV